MKDKYISIALVVVIVILFFSVYSLAGDIRRLRANGAFVYPSSLRNFYHLNQRPATPSDVNLIAEWMTFNYINKSFNLPADYLKTALAISNSSYPNITIAKITKGQSLSGSAYLEKVKNAVSTYLTQKISPQ